MPAIAFAKTEAHGNDFILVSESEVSSSDRARLARALCDRLRGVGGDGLILYRGRGRSFAMELFNSDGSRAEISGNGLRCLAAYVAYRGLAAEGGTIEVSTAAGRLSLTELGREDTRFRFRANLGAPRLEAKEVPFVLEPPTSRAVGVPLEVEGREIAVTALSMGNPHCVVLTEAFDRDWLREMGPRIESHPRFPNQTNVELVQVMSRGELRMGIWERGAGETASSGTGAAASMVAAVLNGLVDRVARVHCPGGTLTVEWDAGGDVLVTGDAVVVAEGDYLIDWRDRELSSRTPEAPA